MKASIEFIKWTDGKRNSIGYSDIFEVFHREILSSLL